MSSEVRVLIDKNFLARLKKDSGVSSNAELMKQALSLLDWSVSETKKGNEVVSYTPAPATGEPLRLTRPLLEALSNAAPHKETP
jgi:hypothetical protein